tara:strand:+ start:9490 stop:9687 length:198 start_codon:yes stop_codon:yes gene_type:complete
MNNITGDIKNDNKIEFLKNILKKQIIKEDKKQEILSILNYLESIKKENIDDSISYEINLLYDCLF